ncbi:hypothetical protein HPP92_000671 [Vanilla planifolia]|uniref:Cysteine proteinase inhibitor n=1 Tax=Vanilla planifolia TaxID=51239 RepID=A0A835RYI9_VANPL|nr:hypothetical protein HPP92_000745 [Vanilla planifolia]KAG0500599.1 hypothetical protein HPP92_000671 [Vanilla planifolia]
MATVGGLRDVDTNQNSIKIDQLARFAVDDHNKKEVVAGTLYHLTLEAIDAGKKELYDVKVWVKPWLNHKELQEFKHVGDGESAGTASADVATK